MFKNKETKAHSTRGLYNEQKKRVKSIRALGHLN